MDGSYSSAPEEKEFFTLHIRGVGGWTKKLHQIYKDQLSNKPTVKKIKKIEDTYDDLYNVGNNQMVKRYKSMRRGSIYGWISD